MNNKGLLFSTIVAILTLAAGSSYALSNPMVSFTDIEQHWGKSAILSAAAAGLVDGYEDRTFKPEQSVSRAEFIKMTATALKLNIGTVDQGAGWYKAYVKALTDAGIFRESDFAAGDMNTPITRLEMSRIAVRAVEKGMQVKEYNPEDNLVMYTATKAGLIQGLAKGDLALDGLTTRAQSVTIIDRMLKKRAGETLPVDKYAVGNAELALKKTNIFTVMPEFFGGDGKSRIDPNNPWDPKKLVMETPDGLFKGAIDQVIAIDMEDPQDPNRWRLGNLDELYWMAAPSLPGFPIQDYPQSYVLFIDRHTDYSLAPDKYGNDVLYGFSGTKTPDRNALNNGTLNDVRPVYKKIPGDYSAYIFPKKGFVLSAQKIEFTILAPAFNSKENQRRILIASYVPDTLGK